MLVGRPVMRLNSQNFQNSLLKYYYRTTSENWYVSFLWRIIFFFRQLIFQLWKTQSIMTWKQITQLIKTWIVKLFLQSISYMISLYNWFLCATNTRSIRSFEISRKTRERSWDVTNSVLMHVFLSKMLNGEMFLHKLIYE